MEKKSYSELIAVVVIILVFVIAIGGVMFHDKFLVDKNKDNNEEETKVLENGEALNLGNQLWKYAYSSYWGEKPAWVNSNGEAVIEGEQCEPIFNEIKKKFSSNFEVESCNSDESVCNKESLDHFLTINSCGGPGRGSLQTYKETKLEVGTVQENEIIFTAISEYCGSSFCHESNETVKTVAKDFVIVKENGEWVIKNFYLPN